MNEAAPRLDVAIVEGIDKIPRDAWDGLLAPDDSPFVEWDWLRAMENSGSAARDTGWAPYHLIVRQGPKKQIVAACPLYLKTHSMGEFVFDHGWADAAERAGHPLLPENCRRRAVHAAYGTSISHRARHRSRRPHKSARPRADVDLRGQQALERARELLRARRGRRARADRIHGTPRLSVPLAQRGFTTFDDYLNRLKHKRRTAVRHERAAMDEQGVHIRVIAGEEIPDKTFADMYRIYCSTIEKLYWGRQYLTPDFFDLIRKTFKRNMVFIGAYSGRELIAGAVNLAKANVMYGRYWGCFREFRFLHFNVCYYAGIEHSILHGIQRYEPGAGGEYKWLRGFDPALTRSIHYVSNPDLKRAIAGFLKRERHEVERWIVAGKERSQLKPPPPSDQESE